MSDDNEDKDLTRIEDLAEFLHDEEDDHLFDEDEDTSTEDAEALPSLDDLDDDESFEQEPSFEEAPPEFESNSEEENSFESSEDSEFQTSDDEFQMSEDNPFENSEFESSEFEGSESEEDLSFTTSEDEEPFATEELDDSALEESEEFFDENEIAPEEDQDSVETPIISSYEERNEPVVPISTGPIQNFDDVKQFAESISYGTVSQGGNPPFSIVLRGIRYHEDAQDIMIILRDHGLVSDDNEKSLEQGLNNGSLLISQISEYSAIYLAHRFRRFDLDVMVGLSDEIHPTHSYDADARGLVSKENIRQNIHESVDLERAPVKIDNIILSTTPTLEGYDIREYLGVVSHHSILSAEEIEDFTPNKNNSGDEIIDAIQKDIHMALDAAREGMEEDEVRPFGQGLENIYQEMADSLRAYALKMGANAVVGINYQLTPVIRQNGPQSDVQYKVTCLGSAVWVVGD